MNLNDGQRWPASKRVQAARGEGSFGCATRGWAWQG